MFSRQVARTVARSTQQAAPLRVAGSAKMSSREKGLQGSMEPAWRERAAIPDYDGWDNTLEESFKKRSVQTPWKKGAANAPLKDGRAGIADSVLDLVGQTPLVRMSRLCAHLGIPEDIDVVAKCEYFSAGGSVKDRVGLRMVREAEADGRLKKGDVIIEPTSGNTGIGLCMAAAVSGYKVIICMPHKMSSEKANTMKALGAEIIRTPNAAGWKEYDSHIALSADLAGVSPNAHVLDQYLNAGNPLSHYEGTAEEILRQTDGELDVIIMTAGTGGTITGIGRKLKEAVPHVKIVAVDPVGSLLAVPDSLNDHKRLEAFQVEGIGYDFIPTVLNRGLIDEWIKVDDPEAFAMARKMIRHEGMLVGGSSGSCMAGAYSYIQANKDQLKGKRIVILCADSIRNYMSKYLADEWMAEHKFPTGTDATDGPTSPGNTLKALVSAKRLKELESAKAAGTCDDAHYEVQKADILARFGAPKK